MALTAGQIVFKSIQKLGMRNRRDTISRDEMLDGLEALMLLLDSMSRERLMIPYLKERNFPLYSTKREYTLGPGGDFDAVNPLEIRKAFLRNSAGTDYPLQVIDAQDYVEGALFKETSVGRPVGFYWNPSYPAYEIKFTIYPLPIDRLHLIVLEPFRIDDFSEYGCCSEADEFDSSGCGCGNADEDCDAADLEYTVVSPSYVTQECIDDVVAQAMLDVTNDVVDCDCLPVTREYTYVQAGQPDIVCMVKIATVAATELPSFKPEFNEQVCFPPGYQNLFIYRLAEMLAPDYNFEVVPVNIARMAQKLTTQIKSTQNRTPQLRVDRGLTGANRNYNIYSGPGGRR